MENVLYLCIRVKEKDIMKQKHLWEISFVRNDGSVGRAAVNDPAVFKMYALDVEHGVGEKVALLRDGEIASTYTKAGGFKEYMEIDWDDKETF